MILFGAAGCVLLIASSFTFQGKPVQEGNEPTADCRIATPNYFKTMGIPLLTGREFTERDLKDAPEVVVINQAMAEQFLPGENPVGKRLQIYPNPPRWREVVGVVGDVKLLGLDADINPAVYVPLPQNPYEGAMRNSFLAVRTTGDPSVVAAAIRTQMKTVDGGVPLAHLSRTPATLNALLRGAPAEWTMGNEGPDTWSPYDVLGHLIHGEETDWIPRAKIILITGLS